MIKTLFNEDAYLTIVSQP